MRSFIATAVAIVVCITYAAGQCSDGSQAKVIDNMSYCSAVKSMTYQNFEGAGSYNKITHMDPESGECSSSPTPYKGPLAPLDDEVSMHFRGPLKLLQFAVYAPGSGSHKKRSPKQNMHDRRHRLHKHFHRDEKENRHSKNRALEEKRQVGALVTATMPDGAVITFTNEYSGATSVPIYSGPLAANPIASSSNAASAATSSAFSTPAAVDSVADINLGSGSWGRQAYYNSGDASCEGLVFLNNMGGSGSGVFNMGTFGNSLSYASSDGKSAASSPQIFGGSLADDNEIVVMGSDACSNGDCGYTRPGTVAHHGFNGAQKAFLMEFQMPMSGATTGAAPDMPAVWMLNAQIPRTLQYGNPNCSCWTSGCGELDLFEVLSTGNEYATTTLHLTLGTGGGSSNYFNRPTTSSIKTAVIFTGSMSTAHIQILDESQTFDSVLTASTISGLGSSGGSTITPIYP